MNFQSMEYFAAVAKNRSFTRAADALHITQQTLSAHIAGIERELGCPLLIRHIPLELTYAGEVFLRYATEFNTKYDCMLHEFGDILNNQTGKLRIGIAFTGSYRRCQRGRYSKSGRCSAAAKIPAGRHN